MKKREKIKIIIVSISAFAFAAAAVFLFCKIHPMTEKLTSQYEAERWAGESDENYVQFSIYVPSTESLDLKGINEFRYKMLDAFTAASLDEPETGYLFTDAWSTADELTVLTDRAKTTAEVIAVGGDFFSFHQPYLLSGSYISDNDFNNDLVVIDKDLAWLLYGGYDLQGMLLYINDRPFIVAGVIDRSSDYEMCTAGTDDMCLFMSFDAYAALTEKSTVTTYEVVMPEVYSGFAEGLITASFSSEKYEIVQNTGRFSLSSLLNALKAFSQRSVRSLPAAFPYWENAARVAEDKSVIDMVCGTAAAFVSAIMLAGIIAAALTGRKQSRAKETDPEKITETDEFTAPPGVQQNRFQPALQTPEKEMQDTFDI